jgi:hypothetical protein
MHLRPTRVQYGSILKLRAIQELRPVSLYAWWWPNIRVETCSVSTKNKTNVDTIVSILFFHEYCCVDCPHYTTYILCHVIQFFNPLTLPIVLFFLFQTMDNIRKVKKKKCINIPSSEPFRFYNQVILRQTSFTWATIPLIIPLTLLNWKRNARAPCAAVLLYQSRPPQFPISRLHGLYSERMSSCILRFCCIH